MTRSSSIDVERLAALIDGKLSGAEAAEVRAQLARADDETVAAFADLVAISAELAESAKVEPSSPLTLVKQAAPRNRPRFRYLAGIAAFAIAASALLIVRTNGASSYHPSELALALAGTSGVRPAISLSTSRGASSALSLKAVSARVGALLFDIEWRSRDGGDTREPMLTLAALLSGVSAANAIADEIRATSQTALNSANRQALGRRVLALVNADVANVAAFLVAIHVAAASRDERFLNSAKVRDIEDAVAATAFSTAEKSQISTVLTLIRKSPPDWTEIDTASQLALQQLAN